MAEGEAHLLEAARLAEAHHLPEIAARARFGLGGALAQHGDLGGAVHNYEEALALSQAAGDHFHEILAHINAAYHYALLGDLPAAHCHIQLGLKPAEERLLGLTCQWRCSTRGEIALAERPWEVAEAWFRRGLSEAEAHRNAEMVATYRANLGLAARGRGDLEGALRWLAEARASTPTSNQRTQVDLWLTELHLERDESGEASNARKCAEASLAGGQRQRLHDWAQELRHRVDRSQKARHS